MHALLRGEVIRALRYNWFLVYSAPYLLILVIERYFLRGQLQQKVRVWTENNIVVWFYVVSYCMWLIIRNILHI